MTGPNEHHIDYFINFPYFWPFVMKHHDSIICLNKLLNKSNINRYEHLVSAVNKFYIKKSVWQITNCDLEVQI